MHSLTKACTDRSQEKTQEGVIRRSRISRMHTKACVLGQNGAQQLFLALGQSLHLPAHPLTPWQRDAQASAQSKARSSSRDSAHRPLSAGQLAPCVRVASVSVQRERQQGSTHYEAHIMREEEQGARLARGTCIRPERSAGLVRCMQLTPLRGTAIAYRRSMGCPAGVYGMSAAERRPAEQCGIVRWRTHDAQRVGPIRQCVAERNLKG